jgi:hypothetical protein
VAATALLWRQLTRRALFFVLSALCLLGLQSIAAPAAISVLLPHGGGLTRAAAHDAFTRSLIASAVIQLTVGVAILWWLYRALRSPNFSSSGRESA